MARDIDSAQQNPIEASDMDPAPQTTEGLRAALLEARQRLIAAEALVVADQPGGAEQLEQARSALVRSSSYPPAAVPVDSEDGDPKPEHDSVDDGISGLRSRLNAFLKSLR